MELVAKLYAGVPEGCPYRARVSVLLDEVYAA